MAEGYRNRKLFSAIPMSSQVNIAAVQSPDDSTSRASPRGHRRADWMFQECQFKLTAAPDCRPNGLASGVFGVSEDLRDRERGPFPRRIH